MRLSTLILRNFHVEAQLDARERERLPCELELILATGSAPALEAVDAEALVRLLRRVAEHSRGASLEELTQNLGLTCLREVGCERVRVALHRRLNEALDMTARAELDRSALAMRREDDRYED